MSKRRVYFDNNIYADIIRQGVRVDLIKNILNRNKLILIISSLNLFEAASCWKSRNSEATSEGVKRFQLFKELLPCRFLSEVSEILLVEIGKVLKNQSFDIFYGGTEAENEINKLAGGIYGDTARIFIENKWNAKSVELQQRTKYFSQIRNLTIPESFHEFLSDHQQLFAEHIIGERVEGIPAKNKRKLAAKMLQKHQKFPLFSSMVRANLFLDFRLLKFSSLSHDTLDDVKHLMLASYADIFISNDEKLHKYFHNINTQLKVLRLSEFMKF